MAEKKYLSLTRLQEYDGLIKSQINSKAPSSHNHSADNITSGQLSPDRLSVVPSTKGGTGKTSLTDSANVLINSLGEGSSTPTDSDYYVSQYAGGGTSTTTYHRRPLSALWTWIKSKADGIYAAKSHGTHVSYSTTNPVMDGIASVGSASTVARSDHKHPTDTSRASAADLDSHIDDTDAHKDTTYLLSGNGTRTISLVDSNGNQSSVTVNNVAFATHATNATNATYATYATYDKNGLDISTDYAKKSDMGVTIYYLFDGQINISDGIEFDLTTMYNQMILSRAAFVLTLPNGVSVSALSNCILIDDNQRFIGFTLTSEDTIYSIGNVTTEGTYEITGSKKIPTRTSELTNDSGFVTTDTNQKIKSGSVTFDNNDTIDITTTVNSGLKVTGNASTDTITIDMDETVTFIFDCGDSTGNSIVTAEEVGF